VSDRLCIRGRRLPGCGPSRSRLLLSVLLCLALPTFAQSLESIPLQHRMAEELIPILQPLIEPGGVLTGTGAVLLVRASADNVQQIRDALAALDQAPRQLLITVGQATSAAARGSKAQGQVTVRTGETPTGTDRTDVSGVVAVSDGAARAEIRNVSSVRALEGVESYVMVGESRPFSSTTVTPGWHGARETHVTEYRDVATGFYVTPRLAGDVVTLEISPQQQFADTAPDRNIRDVVVSQRVSTTVSGRLGVWIEIGGAQQSNAAAQRGILTAGTRAQSSLYGAWIKVDVVP
jgi:type II secretory pathway component GspD/PulD (secretin)